jgi:hypothetical protein
MHIEPSIHDNFIYAYSMDCDARRLVLHTVYRDREPRECTDVIFREVVAHHLEHDLPENILLDVEEVDVASIVKDNERMFAESWRYGWPPVEYRGNLQALVEVLTASSIRAWSIDASFGLSGWVLARDCVRVPRREPANAA